MHEPYRPASVLRTYRLFLSLKGKMRNIAALHIIMDAENLTVSWNRSSKLPDNLKAYVVQYKQYGGGPGQSFDWARLNSSQTTVFFRGLLLMLLETQSNVDFLSLAKQ